jgi:hypothetical protein
MPKQNQQNRNIVTLTADVEFLKNEKDEDISSFSINAYTGATVSRRWGDMVIDLSGVKSKEKIPVLKDHDTAQIVGFGEVKIDKSITVSGDFSSFTQSSAEVKSLSKEGFPWQASIGAAAFIIEDVQKGAFAQVNGRKVSGPIEIWRETQLREVSILPLGADAGTSVSVFNYEAPESAKGESMTLEELEKDAPELLAQIKASAYAEGKKAEALRVKAVREQFLAGHEALIETLMFDGTTTGEQAAVLVLKAERTKLENLKTSIAASTPKPVQSTFSETPSTQLTTDSSSAAPVGERAKAAWEKSADLRGEFEGDYEAFEAYFKATERGSVRILKNKEEK